MNFNDSLEQACGSGNIRRDELMSSHTTFRIGGPARYFVTPADQYALRDGIAVCRDHDVPYFVMGNGSNLLVGDGGYNGVIFSICRTMDSLNLDEGKESIIVTAGAGCMLSQLAKKVSLMGYTGFEYATGIPGTLGGAVTMNAGAYGGEISDSIMWADLMDESGNTKRLDKEALDLSYRHSVIMDSGYIVLMAALRFSRGEPDRIMERVSEVAKKRRQKQPLEYPSAGSTFKRPEGYFAGKLIQDSGLKGYSIGGAAVSEKHSGFIINTGKATAADVRDLIGYVQKTVEEKFGVKMEPEVKFIGKFI